MGRAPQLTEINRAFESLFVSLADLKNIGTKGKFKTDVTLQTIQKIQKSIELLRSFVQKAFLGNTKSEKFDENDFESKLANVTKNINFLFLKSINHDCITSYEKVTLQTSMTSSIQCIRENVKNAILQPDRIECLKAAIIEFNMKLEKEYINKGYLYPVKINFEQNS
ncbi:hypothetical protein TVAG_330330 [Trichomonas vaginalis G3]|uniref:Uncharacterized protein n=1 Tax=Trichomonas vaginalis (strain ATCC PRA-98 / G3) TaxID=412133 RepID=A2GD82_TRIV3|nr:hypothetical protein TVAGG3_0777360 [Trichomonas vaginalis G3]EAX84885.1 hypothetical protein TVAG_330330 [Trichomonas vaginalis G3]KAI5494813.1 hypothetical protein TVAGG3_0777360 [Trichomonas vaginalis G3]|eukprot:XP_001297815.1 hypothetical protein [Trichomonas vaginalis G3]